MDTRELLSSRSGLRCEIPQIRRAGKIILKPQQVEFDVGVTHLLGMNGAGKTTFFASLMGILHPATSSTLGLTTTRVRSADRAKFMSAVGYLPQEVPAPKTMRLREFVAYAAWLKNVDKSSEKQLVQEALDQVNLASESSKLVSKLSGGMRRRAGIAAAIVHRPQVLILDEATAGLDPVERHRLYAILYSLAAKRVVLSSTHLLEDVEGVEGEVRVLHDGVFGPPIANASSHDLVELMHGQAA